MPGENTSLEQSRSRTRPHLLRRVSGCLGDCSEAELFLDPKCGRITRIVAACPFRISPSLLLTTPLAPNNFHLTVLILYPFLSCKVPLPKYGLAYHAFRPPRPRARSWCSCGKRRPKDQSLAFGHLSPGDYLPCLLYSLCRCK
jgi:hypothetical protein